MKDMFAVLEKTSELIEDIKMSDVYVEYKAALYELQKDPELMAKADLFRKEQYDQVQTNNRPVGFWEVAHIEEQYEKVANYPVVVRFLNAELALCRLVQSIQADIVAAIDFR